MSTYPHLNTAQHEAVLHHEGPLLILAGAGAGKTRVIVHRIADLIRSGVAPERILAVTFTNKAAREMQERVETLIRNNPALSPNDIPQTRPFIGTFHALSLLIIKTFHAKAGLPLRFTIYDRQDSTRALKEAISAAGFDPKSLEPRRVMSIMGRAKGDALSREDFLAERASSYVDEAVAEVWERYEAALKKEHALDFDDILLTAYLLLKKHDDVRTYFQNAWQYLHVDEYQDTNRVQYELVKMLGAGHGNIAAVGDADQCVTKGTKILMADGTEKPVEKIRVGDFARSNYGSGDMRPARVSRIRMRIPRKGLITIRTVSGKTLTSTPEHIHFAGYRLGLTPQKYFSYLMHKKDVGWRLGVSQVYTRGQKDPVVGFKLRANHERADAVWVVGVHACMQEARINEYTLSLRYRIPTLPFVARKGISVNGYVHDQDALNKIFASFDTTAAAARLLSDFGLSLDFPHHRAQAKNGTRRNVTVTLCGDRRGSVPMHRIAMVGNDAEGARALQALGFSVRKAKADSRSWRFETARASYAELLRIISHLRTAFPDLVLVQNARLGGTKRRVKDGNSLPFMPASSVLPGMVLFDATGGYDIVESVERNGGSGRVYDIDVESTHNFIANGIATHNCIYSWRGASLDNILNFEHDFPDARVILLTENYRSTKTIITAANDAIAKNIRRKEKELFTNNADGEKIQMGGFVDENEEALFVARESARLIAEGINKNEIAVLYRANFQSRVLEEAFLRHNIAYQVLGTRFFERKEVKDALSYLRLAGNPNAAADLSRALSAPPRGIGKVTLAKIVNGEESSLPAAAKEKVRLFRNTLSKIEHAIETKPASEAMRIALEESGMWRLYEKGDSEDAERLENLKELVTVAAKYDAFPPGEGIAKLIEEAALQSDQDELEKEKKKDGVKLMTVHAAKGLEFEVVFITGLEEGLFPHERDGADTVDDEEERRLFYVALTRAKQKVYTTYAISRRIFGTRSMNMPSEFVTELDDALAEVVAMPLYDESDHEEEIT